MLGVLFLVSELSFFLVEATEVFGALLESVGVHDGLGDLRVGFLGTDFNGWRDDFHRLGLGWGYSD